MNLTNPESFLSAQSQRNKERKRFSATIEVAGKTISKGDVVDIANKKGEMVQYKVTNIVLNDDGPSRLILQSLDGKINTFKDLNTLNKKPESFRVLTKQEYADTVEPHLDEMFDSIQSAHQEAQYIKNVERELNSSVSILKKEVDRIDTLRETIARMLTPEQKKQVQEYAVRTKQTSVLKHRNGFRVLWDEMQADALQHQDLVDRNLRADEEIMALRGFRPITKEDLADITDNKLTDILSTIPREHIGATPLNPEEFSKPSPTPLSRPDTIKPTLSTQTTPSFLQKITSNIRNLFQKKPELQTSTVLPRTTHTEHASPTIQSKFNPPPGFETPTLQSIKETISGTKRTLYETDPEMVAQTKRDANKAAEQMTQNTQRSTMMDAGYADRYAAYQKDRDTAPTPSFFGNIQKLFGRLFSRQPEVQTGASLSRTVYRPDADPKSPPPDNIIPFPQPKERKPQDTDSGMLEAAE